MDQVFRQLLAVQVLLLLVSAACANTLYFQPSTDSVVCPDNKHTCNSDTTCCILPNGQYGCCMYANAVCCSDNIHCCPTGSYCDVNTGSCDKGGIKFEWSKKSPAALYIPKEKVESHLPWIESIPPMETELHQQQPESIPWAEKLPGLKINPLNISSFLNSPSSCSVSKTLCKSDSGLSGCCPFPNAVCCDKGQMCCPSGFQCNLKSSKCEKPTEETPIEITELQPVHTLFELRDPTVCPDGVTVCPTDSTCCLVGKTSYACCPYPKATCCSDHQHCCPNDYTCDLAAGECVKKQVDLILVKMVKWQAGQVCPDMETTCPEGSTCCPLHGGRYGCCPYPKAVCCSDNYHCCPSGYTCDVKASKCQIISLGLTTCPDHQTQCSSGMTCCEIEKDVYGCCPFAQATCCTDGQHCCPNGYQCDLKESKCIRHKSQIQSAVQSIVCPDQITRCPSSSTCCKLIDGSYGCCPYAKATCCTDGQHCCPNGYQCDLKESKCIRHKSQIQSAVQSIVCPDQITRCPSSSTCCKLIDGSYGCCPYAKATCCKDDLHCCPHGYTCDVKAGMCHRKSVGSTEMSLSLSVIQKSATVTCPDMSHCSGGSTCCLSGGRYGCCPIPQAKCCSDQKHCCPENFICDPVMGRCRIETRAKLVSLTSLSVANVTYSCPDSQCPTGSTCCPISSRRFGCCPLPKAVCCHDDKHCCPKNYHCDLEHKRCVMGQTSLPLFKKSLSSKPLIAMEPPKKPIKSVMCPDYNECPDHNTCCLMDTGAWGCCPYLNAVCCIDRKHCCPKTYFCDMKHSKCVSSKTSINPIVSMIYSKIKPAK